ncbi:MAG: DUF3124 domain-containing protein [Desulfobacterales bacterium]|nr:DUF3124 domain-containing protein [Desulfobacterales bacterium]MDJ0885643.1 DUF3124 domain-containing protein [Desulfobacterales bacterium]
MQTVIKGARYHGVAVLLGMLLILTETALAASVAEKTKGQTLYVPVYSHIYSGDRERPVYLASTLSIRNTDPSRAIRIINVDYFNSEGQLLRRYLEQPIELGPMASTRYIVGESDKTGGSGANFIVRWEAAAPVSPPVAEGIMISTASQLGISFTSRGRVIPAE